MGSLGLIGAVGIGVTAVLTPAVLVWAVVLAGLRQVAQKDARAERPADVQLGSIEG